MVFSAPSIRSLTTLLIELPWGSATTTGDAKDKGAQAANTPSTREAKCTMVQREVSDCRVAKGQTGTRNETVFSHKKEWPTSTAAKASSFH